MDWWDYVASLPEPRVLVLQDCDHRAGVGAFVGEIHANIGSALKCVGCVTNGAVRDLTEVEALGFHLFSGSVSPSHSYAHIVEFGEPVEIGGLKISPGTWFMVTSTASWPYPYRLPRKYLKWQLKC